MTTDQPSMSKHDIAARLWANGDIEAYHALVYYIKQDDKTAAQLSDLIVHLTVESA